MRVKRVRGGLKISEILRELGRREIQNVMIEAGTKINSSALVAGVVDKLVIFGADTVAGRGAKPWAEKRVADKIKTVLVLSIRHIGPDYCYTGYLRDVYGNH
jgi:diaminohydroxyphosphoribosylaminopyrimidine deaminase / 5-amino-6-(5-phosphoribosylamino)uracil reductase